MSSEKLQQAVETVREWVNKDEIVGAVMLVLRHDKIVLHEAVGWSDRENKLPMKLDTIVSLRSMTKPLVGTAILLLMEEGRLRLDDKVAQYLPAFDNPKSRDITLYQLLTHTSGLTGAIYDTLKGTQYKSLREAVDDVGRMGPSFKPGTDYRYSDPGSSTLGALIAQIAGLPAEEFIEKRILDPLQMKDSFCEIRGAEPRRPRIASAYRLCGRAADDPSRAAGSPNECTGASKWIKYWDNTRPPIVPFFRASGGLYSTAMDYARFMALMLHRGRFGNLRLLAPATVRLATSPHSAYVYDASQLREKGEFYGLHWFVVTDKYAPLRTPASPGTFFHGRSDGPFAWADPAQDLIGIYLTRSRGDASRTRPRFMNLIYAALEE